MRTVNAWKRVYVCVIGLWGAFLHLRKLVECRNVSSTSAGACMSNMGMYKCTYVRECVCMYVCI